MPDTDQQIISDLVLREPASPEKRGLFPTADEQRENYCVMAFWALLIITVFIGFFGGISFLRGNLKFTEYTGGLMLPGTAIVSLGVNNKRNGKI